MSVGLDHVIAAARSGAASLAAELCGYIVLGAADQVARAPCQLLASGVELGSEGEVRIYPGRAADEIAAEGSLRRLLSQLLEAARSGSPALQRVSRRPLGHGVAALVGEVEAALVPVNRSAARRALARLHREAMRAQLPLVSEATSEAVSLPSSQMSAPVQVVAANRVRVPDEQPREPSQPASPAPDGAELCLPEQTDPMDTGYGSLPRAEHRRLTSESSGSEQAGQTPKLGSMAVSVSVVEQEEHARPSWSGGAIHVDVDDLGDETPLLSRPALGPGALPSPCPPAAEVSAAETEAVASAAESDEADGPGPRPSVPPASAAPDPPVPARAEPAATGSVAPLSKLETLVEGFTAAECRSVHELCRELQQLAGLEGREGQSSVPPSATTDEAP